MFGAIRAAASRSSVRVSLFSRAAAHHVLNDAVLQAFSTTSSRAADLAKLTLIGHLTRDPETRYTKNEKEYVVCVLNTCLITGTDFHPGILSQHPTTLHLLLMLMAVSTKRYALIEAKAWHAERVPPVSTFHRVISFTEGSNKYLQTLRKGSRVYVEAGFELREPEPNADPTTPQGQRQIFLRHG